MRPKLKEGVQPLRRAPRGVQLGLDPERAVVFDGLEPAEYALLSSLDGSRSTEELRRAAQAVGIPPSRVDRLLGLLRDADLLDDASLPLGLLGRLELSARDRLAPDLRAWSLLGGSDGGAAILERRAHARVLVLGAARLGVAVARLLAASAVGLVDVEDEGPVRSADMWPGGFEAEHRGADRADTARRLVAADSPLPTALRPAALVHPRWDAVVLVPEAVPETRRVQMLVRGRVPHLLVTLRETTGLVGPLVLPGQSTCLHCVDLHRVARDRDWPALSVQLSQGQSGVNCAETTLVGATASLAAMQLLLLLDRRSAQADAADPELDLPAVDGTLEVRLPHGTVRRRAWSPHPSCPCGADEARHGDPDDRPPGTPRQAGEVREPAGVVDGPTRAG